MEHLLKLSVFLGLYTSCLCREGIRLSDKRRVTATQMGNREQAVSNPGYQALLEAASDGYLSRSEIEMFAPDTPSPNDVECYVEVETYRTERIGGRCVNFGRTTLRICQAGEHSSFSNECRITTDRPTP